MHIILALIFIFLNTTILACVHHEGVSVPLSVSDVLKANKPLAPVLKGLGDYEHRISTENPETQKFFDQGMALLFGFYYTQAIRSFQEAARLDPSCAMCWWGVAYALGPNINAPMNPKNKERALEAITKAKALAPKATQEENDWINALAERYHSGPQAYAEAMEALWKKYPKDLDVGVLYAEALMDTQPWDYWEADGKTPKGHGEEIISTLEDVIKQNPDHPQALHLYIHALEASDHPEKAEFAADRLNKLMPGIGHIVHMPSHIYFRVGRYADAVKVNEQATKVDKEYIATSKAQGFDAPAFYGHNIYFAWAAWMMLGQYEEAITAARQLVDSIEEIHMADTPGPMENMLFTPLATMVRFGKWNEILIEPIPPKTLTVFYSYDIFARGFAHANLNEIEEAKKNRDTLLGLNKSKLINLEIEMLEGEIDRVSGNLSDAIKHFQKAQEIEKSLPYTDPPVWLPPVSHNLQALEVQGKKN
jgi:tetratricopeptide (TPR) repeat protein